MKADENYHKLFYIIGWVCICVLTVLLIIWKAGFLSGITIPPCTLRSITGYYCPGCGGTRAVRFLLQGRVLKSLYYHPIVVYTAVFGSWFMISQTIQRLSKGKIAIGMHYRDIYLWIALGLVLANCLIKNLVLAMTGYAMM